MNEDQIREIFENTFVLDFTKYKSGRNGDEYKKKETHWIWLGFYEGYKKAQAQG